MIIKFIIVIRKLPLPLPVSDSRIRGKTPKNSLVRVFEALPPHILNFG